MRGASPVTGHGGQLQNVAQLFRTSALMQLRGGCAEMDILQKATNRAFTGCSAVFLYRCLARSRARAESFAQSHGRRLKHRSPMGVVCTSQDLRPAGWNCLARDTGAPYVSRHSGVCKMRSAEPDSHTPSQRQQLPGAWRSPTAIPEDAAIQEPLLKCHRSDVHRPSRRRAGTPSSIRQSVYPLLWLSHRRTRGNGVFDMDAPTHAARG